MTDAKDYSVEYAGTAVKFTATDGAVAKVGITTKEIPAASATEVKATTAKFTIAASADGKTPAKDVTCVGSFRFYYTTE